MTRNWIAAHIYYSGDLNLLLTAALAPFIKDNMKQLDPHIPWFFIRYPEGGDHIRFRMNTIYPDYVREKLERETALFFKQYPQRNMRIEHFPYEPEITRYGDEETLFWAELHFSVSSQCILKWLCDNQLQMPSARIYAIQLHLLLLLSTGWSSATLLSLCDHFIDDWMQVFYPVKKEIKDKDKWLYAFKNALTPQKELLFEATHEFWINAGKNLLTSATLLSYFEKNKLVMAGYNAAGLSVKQLTVAITSMMHMTHNRLGIENPEEAYIMYCTRSCLLNILSKDNYPHESQ